MDEILSVFFLSIIRPTNPYSGLVGGLIGLVIGFLGREKYFRWFVSYSLVGVFGAFLFLFLNGTSKPIFQSQIHLFLPLFTTIGFVWSGFFKYRYPDFDWRLLALFPVIGILAAILYQSRGVFLWFCISGAILGGISWFFVSRRLGTTLFFAGLGLLITLLLFADSYSSLDVSIVVLGCVIGAVIGWFIKHQTIKWTIALGALGAITGGTVEYAILISDLALILIVITVSGFLGVFIGESHYRELITFVVFGALLLCGVISGWEIIKILEYARMY